MRMIVVSQLDQTGLMRGLVTTLAKRHAMIAPASAPIIYRRLDDPEAADYGEITARQNAFTTYRDLLRAAVSDGYCSVVSP
jgi:hypothetical protein